MDITHQRLYYQRFSHHKFNSPGEVVSWFGALQAQDYPGSLWAIGLRMHDATESSVEKAVADKSIVRTWPMRGTLHFVSPADIRWMLPLMTPRIIANSKGRYKQFALDEATFAQSRSVIENALQGGNHLTRDGLYQVMEAGGVSTEKQRGLHILGHLAQEGLICLATRKGKQPTFALLEEWVPPAPKLERDEALAEIARRYFTSHGPATLQDFVWWTGLITPDAKAGLEMAKPHLVQDVINGTTYWRSPDVPPADNGMPDMTLLPPYDEYTVAYKDRSAFLDPAYMHQAKYGIFNSVITVDGRIIGLWKRTLKKDTVVIESMPFTPFTDAQSAAFATAAQQYGEFLGLRVSLG